MARASLAAALAAALLVAVPAAGGAPGAETPRRGGTVVFGPAAFEPACLNPLVCGYAPVNQKVLTPAFAVAPDLTLRPMLVSDVVYTKSRPSRSPTAFVPKPAGATVSPSPLGTSSSPTPRS